MKAIWIAVTVLLLITNVAAAVAQLFVAGAPWYEYVNLFGVVLFGYFVCRLVYWECTQ